MGRRRGVGLVGEVECDTYFECLTNTENNPQSAIKRSLRLARNELHYAKTPLISLRVHTILTA